MKLFVLLFFVFQGAFAEVEINSMAPDFKLQGHDGKWHELKDFRGKTVVLEWFNHGCPFVRKHYDSQNMQKLQKKYTEKNIVWLQIVSSAAGKQGHLSVTEAKEKHHEEGSFSQLMLLDPKGEIGQKYGAKTTPHMFIVNKKGQVVYQGAIDSIASADSSDISKAQNYIALGLDQILAGKTVSMHRSRPYGCSVKY